jgi:hypothetical protein
MAWQLYVRATLVPQKRRDFIWVIFWGFLPGDGYTGLSLTLIDSECRDTSFILVSELCT